jgi:hypothetical protein
MKFFDPQVKGPFFGSGVVVFQMVIPIRLQGTLTLVFGMAFEIFLEIHDT